MSELLAARARDAAGYHYPHSGASHTQTYLWPTVLRILEAERARTGANRVFDLGCGNGAFTATLTSRGFETVGVDPSVEGVRVAREAHPGLRFNVGSAYDPLRARYGDFPLVVSLEVVEHVYAPREFAASVFDLVASGGLAVISTPYHGYLKNLTMALTGRLDAHFTALWDHGHIKFWSRRTLRMLLQEAGFGEVVFHRVGRIPPLAKSMIAVARPRCRQ